MNQTLSASELPPLVAPEAAAKRQHIAGLALLRGIAALSVALFHFTRTALPKLHVEALGSLCAYGWLGVDVFFVISGFVIPYSLVGKGYSIRKFGPYIAKRIVRINPPAYVALLLVLAQWYFIDTILAHYVHPKHAMSLARLAHNVLFTVPFSEQRWIVGVFWTLAIEFQFYIFIGVLFGVLFEHKSLWWFVGIMLVLGVIKYLPFRNEENLFKYSSLFAMGGLTLFLQQGRLKLSGYLSLLALFSTVAYLECGVFICLAGLLTALAIYYVKIENAFTRFAGNVSYSFYLTHLLVGGTCEFILTRFISVNSVATRLVLQAICLAMSVVVAYLFYLVIERPFMRLASRLRV